MTRTNPNTLQKREVVSCLNEHAKWRFDGEKQAFDEASGVRMCECMDELRFAHTDAGGVLLLRSPVKTDSGAVCEGVLQQALDRRERSNVSTDPFLAQLIAAQQAIAETYETECITTIQDPVSILRVEFRADHNHETVSQLITDVASATEEIQHLHEELIETVQKYQ